MERASYRTPLGNQWEWDRWTGLVAGASVWRAKADLMGAPRRQRVITLSSNYLQRRVCFTVAEVLGWPAFLAWCPPLTCLNLEIPGPVSRVNRDVKTVSIGPVSNRSPTTPSI
jgi:hypothetical protein